VVVGVLRKTSIELVLLYKGHKSRSQLEIIHFDGRVNNGGGETGSLQQDVVSQHSSISSCHGNLLLSVSYSALSTCSSFDFRVKRNERLIPSTAPVQTKPKTIPSVSKPKWDSKGVEDIKKKRQRKGEGKENDLV